MNKKIIIADDHPLFRAAMKLSLDQILDNAEVHEVGSIDTLQILLSEESKPDLILLDLHMPGAHGFSGLLFLISHYPDTPVVIVSSEEDSQVISKVIHYGALGFIPKSLTLENLHDAINAVLSGQQWLPAGFSLSSEPTEKSDVEVKLASLTPQQFRVLGMIGKGMLNKQIAYDLDVSEATIKAHLTAIFKKLGVRSRTQAVITIKSLDMEANKVDVDNDIE